jgi:hypothetical protein
MGIENYNDVGDFFRQAVDNEARPWFENNAITWNFLEENADESLVFEKGWRSPAWTVRPGGFVAYTPDASDFNAYVPPQTNSFYIFPVGFAHPAVMPGALIDALSAKDKDAVISAADNITWHTDAAAKQCNYLSHGDGSYALAYSSSSLTAGANQTLNCTTTASTTVGQTKGATRLEATHSYQAWDTSTGLPRGTVYIQTAGFSSCTVTVTGSVNSGDPITAINSYNKAFRGLGWLVSGDDRVLQMLNTANFPYLNSPQLDLANRLQTPTDLSRLKAMLQTVANSPDGAAMKKCIWTPGMDESLRAQGYGYRMYTNAEDTVQGVASRYRDGDTEFLRDADANDDRTVFIGQAYMGKGSAIRRFITRKYGLMNQDGQEMRMLFGANGTGSEDFQMAWGGRWNLGNVSPMSTAVSIRAATADLVTQTNARG